MVSLFFALNRYDLILGYTTIYLIGMGHLSLNGLYDKETDKLNPRNYSLKNPFTEEMNLLTEKIVYFWVSFLWGIALVINIIFLPNNNIEKTFISFIFFSICIVFSIIYSAPPIRLKGRPIIDLLSTFFVFGVCFPLYSVFITTSFVISNGIIITTYIPGFIILLGTLFNITLLVGMHMPTVLGDLEYDKQAGDITTAVYLGWEKGSKVTVIASLFRTLSLGIIVTWLLINDILLVNWFILVPYLLALPDLYYTFYLWQNYDRRSTLNLWKSNILTSILGGFSIGYLYFSKNPDLFNQYFIALFNIRL